MTTASDLGRVERYDEPTGWVGFIWFAAVMMINMLIGIVVSLSGLGVLSGNVLARAVGVGVASLSLIASLVFLPAYPVWALVVISLDVLVIWALTEHGREVRAA